MGIPPVGKVWDPGNDLVLVQDSIRNRVRVRFDSISSYNITLIGRAIVAEASVGHSLQNCYFHNMTEKKAHSLMDGD